jgi:predicted RNase H-like HicB family nuclease
MDMKYLVVIEKGPKSYGAYVPDLPGCVAVAKTAPRVKRLIREAIELHVQDMRHRGEPIPRPAAEGEFIELDPLLA